VNPVVIIGGGLSGLAAAVTLASRKLPLHLLEQKPALGGRAFSFIDTTTGDTVDNGQHLLIAGYDRTMKFLERVGSVGLLRVQPHPFLRFHHPQKGFRTFSVPLISPPRNLAIGILRSNLFSVADRFRLLRAGRSILGYDAEELAGLTIDQWLDRCGQNEETRRCFWEPLAISMMNEHTRSASALIFVRSLRKAFLSSPRSAALAFPRVGLSELFSDPTQRFLERQGANVQCRAHVAKIHITRGRVNGVELRNGRTIRAVACILAVPVTNAVKILPEDLRQPLALLTAARTSDSPIVSIHLWFEHDCMEHDFVGLIGRHVQWVFNKRKLGGGARPNGYLSAVISAAHDTVRVSNGGLVRIAMEDLRSVYGTGFPDPTHSMVIREKKATFSLTPGIESLRPDARTAVPNLFLAGDWTATGYPATIEGAIISGEKAGELATAWCERN
jgi:squalene-associated FAD-dependent desaturase